MNAHRIKQIAGRWRWQLGLRDTLFALGAAGSVASLTLFWTASWTWLALLAFLTTLTVKLTFSRPWTLDAARVVRHLDRAYPDLEESSALWLRAPESLTLLQRLQLRRIDTAISWVIPDDPPPGNPPRGFLQAAGWCGAGGLLVWAVVGAWTLAHGPGARRAAGATAGQHAAAPAVVPGTRVWPKVVGGGLTITPPAYTGRAAHRVEGFSAEVEEGAYVTWTLGLDRPVAAARFVFGEGGGADLPLRRFGENGLGLTATRTVTDGGLYHLNALLPDGTAWNPPELYSLKVIKDHPPTLRILQPAQARTIIEPSTPPPRVSVEVLAGDDYGVGEAHLVATVAKGSGEAVKFREQTLPFDADTPAPGVDLPHARRFARTLDFGALGMEPGDELYFFVEAHDARVPTANRTRSETRFLVLRGPEERAPTAGRGVAGINLVPKYFRSERQIIIDTEKLLADRPTIPDAEFRQRANDLGADQQILRLRYGEFLGEELEGSAVTDRTEVNLNPLQAAPPVNSGPHAAASITQRFAQEHIEQDRGEGGDGDAGPRAAPEKPLAASEVRQPFVDSHDTQDAATLFDRDTKGTMKDALAAMWDAEGCLRTNRVPDALAPEHRALDILKELQQADRAYVQHVGFEAAPLKIAERRLKGDATGAPALASDRDALPPADPAAGAVRAALGSIPWDAPPAGHWPPETLDVLRRIEAPLTAAATRRPEVFLDGLQILRRLRADGGPAAPVSADALRPLERALWRLLPPATSLPERAAESAPMPLTDAYFKARQDGGQAKP